MNKKLPTKNGIPYEYTKDVTPTKTQQQLRNEDRILIKKSKGRS